MVLLLLVEETEEVTKPDKFEILKIRVICPDIYFKILSRQYVRITAGHLRKMMSIFVRKALQATPPSKPFSSDQSIRPSKTANLFGSVDLASKKNMQNLPSTTSTTSTSVLLGGRKFHYQLSRLIWMMRRFFEGLSVI